MTPPGKDKFAIVLEDGTSCEFPSSMLSQMMLRCPHCNEFFCVDWKVSCKLLGEESGPAPQEEGT